MRKPSPIENTLHDEAFEGAPDSEVESRCSLNSCIDWNSKKDLEHYIVKQHKIQDKQGFRPSEYFGAITVDKLEDGIDDSRLEGKSFLLFSYHICK